LGNSIATARARSQRRTASKETQDIGFDIFQNVLDAGPDDWLISFSDWFIIFRDGSKLATVFVKNWIWTRLDLQRK
jgi:hypothetical protein